ncbi:MAG: hypothetical protein IT307_09240 [Chloroflexi bacterium]|nr:hypothetical protein [Chloroflexota bacterium]
MADYERQWALAAGHQERHPLRLKMERLRDVIEQLRAGADLSRIVADGRQSEDPALGLLCGEIEARLSTMPESTSR